MQQFADYIYPRKFDFIDLDELRHHDFRTLPPSKDALFQHLLRASYQSGWVWGNSLLQEAPPQKKS